MIVSIEKLRKSFTDKSLLNDLTLYISEGEKVGIIGQNGCGKSTLLKLLARQDRPDDGTIIFGNHVVTRYLPQNPEFPSDMTLLEGVMDMCKVEENFWNLESQAKALLNRLGLNDFDIQCKNLSGGQKKRAALAAVLLAPADLLILDEPTNHLDSWMIEWLEEYLKKYKGALIMVTHDRYFLDSVTNRIVEIFRGQAFSYQTNYSGYLEKKMERLALEQSMEQKRQNLLRNELAWVRRGARARSTKQKARLERFEELSSRAIPEQEDSIQISAASSRMGRTTIELSHIEKSYGDKTFIRGFSYIFRKKDRIGFIGPNGCGKTTLMKMIAGQLRPDRGEITVGQTITIGYYSQMISEQPEDGISYMDPDKRVIDYIRDTAEFVRTEEGLISATRMLERFLFSSDQQYNRIGKLSGGEKRRLNLLRVLMQAPNVLILDEPTNDLDITTLTVLEDYLDSFDGIVIVVSHDRYFLDRIVNRIFAFEEGGNIKQYEGGYTDYYWKTRAVEHDDPSVTNSTTIEKNNTPSAPGFTKKGKPRENKLKFTWQEAKDYESIETQILQLEEKMSTLQEEMVKAGSSYVKVAELQKELDQVECILEEKMERWDYLEDLAAKIKAQNTSE